MSNLRDVAEKIKRLQNERQNLIHKIEEIKKQADSKATALESEVSILREELRIEESKKLLDSKTAPLESEVSMVHEEPRTEEPTKLPDSETKDLESEVSALREELKALRMILPSRARPKKKPRRHFFR